MTTINWPAVRAFNRLAAPIIEASSIAEEADAGFDGGEWSRGWHSENLLYALDALNVRVALAFDIDAEALWTMRTAAAHHEVESFMRKIQWEA